MANPFLVGDATSTFPDGNSTFNPFLTSTSTTELESHNDNPFFSTFSSSNSVQDNTNPFLSFSQNTEVAQPVADLLGINEKPHTTVVEDASKIKPPPPRPAPPKRPPPRPTPPSNDAKELILSVTGEMDATSLHLLDRLGKTPSPTPMRDLLSPSPTPTADLLGCEDLQPPISSESSTFFDQQPDTTNIPSGTKPGRPQLPPKIDFLMDDLLEDVPIDEDIHHIKDSMQNKTSSISENQPKTSDESKTASRKSSNEIIPPVRRLSHDVTESRKIMPDLSKIADRRKSDIGHFAPTLPSRKPTSQSNQSLENKSDDIIQEINELEDKSKIEVSHNVSKNSLLSTEKVYEQKEQVNMTSEPPIELNTTWNEEKNGLDFESQQQIESSNQFNVNPPTENIETNDTKLTQSPSDFSPIELTAKKDLLNIILDENVSAASSETIITTTDGIVKQKSIDMYDTKLIHTVPDSSSFQEISPQETSFNTVFEASEKITSSLFDSQEPKQLDSVKPTVTTESFPTTSDNDAFDAFAAKFDDSLTDFNASGGAFDAFGGVSEGTFVDTTTGFGTDDNFDSFLSTQQIPSAPQSTPARVTRNNSGESLDENDFNVFIR